MLSQLFLPAIQRQRVQEIPDSRVLPYGGPFKDAVPDVDRSHNELIEYDRQTPTAANIVAYGAMNVRSVRQTNSVVASRAVQMVKHYEFTPEDVLWLDSVAPAIGVPEIQDAVNALATRYQTFNRQGLEITKGYLKAAMVFGEIDWSVLGFQFGSTNFGMNPADHLDPTNRWRNADGSVNADATPVSDVDALNVQVTDVYGLEEYDVLGLSRAAYRAALKTNEYIALAKSRTTFADAQSIPNADSRKGKALAEDIFGMEVRYLDQTFEQEDVSGNRTNRRYTPERLACVWHKSDEGNAARWEMSKVPITKMMIAKMGGNSVFGGAVARGPVAWGSTEDRQFTNAALYMADEGIPRRLQRGVSAVIETRAAA